MNWVYCQENGIIFSSAQHQYNTDPPLIYLIEICTLEVYKIMSSSIRKRFTIAMVHDTVITSTESLYP